MEYAKYKPEDLLMLIKEEDKEVRRFKEEKMQIYGERCMIMITDNEDMIQDAAHGEHMFPHSLQMFGFSHI